MSQWGVMGCADIARKNIRALCLAHSVTESSGNTNGKVSIRAIASRSLDRAIGTVLFF